MENMRVSGGLVLLLVWFVVGVTLPGCSAGENSLKGSESSQPPLSKEAQLSRDQAIQHVIDGSLLETKGDYARAALEYQDALRAYKDPAIYYALSKCYAALSKHTLAIENGREAVRLAADNTDYRRSLAGVFVNAFELDSAAAQYEELVKRDSGNIDSWFNLARLYQARRPMKALEVYNAITQRFGLEWDVLLQVAELYNAMGQFERAADALKKMTEIDPSNLELKRSLSQSYVRARKLDEALAVLNELRERDPGRLDYLAEIGGVYLMQKDYANATTAFEGVMANDSVSVEAKLHIGEMYFGQLEKDSTLAPMALSLFERIRDKHPSDWRAYWFLGAIGAIGHNDSVAERNFRRVTELASWNPDAWVYLSEVFLQKNDYQQVVTVLESALKVLPDDARVNTILGFAYNRLGRTTDAVRVLEHALSINPQDLNTITELALVYDGLKRYEESDSLYEKALRLDPNNHLVQNNYGYSLADRNVQIERAYQMATKAIETQPDNQSYLDTMGWVYFRMGNYSEAERFVKKAIEKGNANSVLYDHLGDIYAKMNDTERALEQWKIALKLDEKNPALLEKINQSKRQ